MEERITNREVFLIAHSMIKENRLQSYVAHGDHTWLESFFANEKIFALCLVVLAVFCRVCWEGMKAGPLLT